MGRGKGCPICEGMMHHHMGHHGMGGMMGGKGGMMGMFMKPWKMMMIGEKIGLNDDQKKRIRDILMNAKRQKVKIKCEIKLRKIDVMDLVMREDVNMAEVEPKIREIANLKADKWITKIKAMQDAKGVLTPDQRKKLKEMFKKWMKGGEEGSEEDEDEEEEEESEEE